MFMSFLQFFLLPHATYGLDNMSLMLFFYASFCL